MPLENQHTQDAEDFDTEYEESYDDSPRGRKLGRSIKLAATFAIVLVLGFAGGVRVGAAGSASMIANLPIIGDSLDSTPDQNIDFTDFWKVYNILQTRFVQTHASSSTSTPQTRLEGAIAGLTSSYGDPYTVFFPPAQAKSFNDQISGNFGGVGMEIGINSDGNLSVIAPLKGTPSEKAGFLPGDVILSINGVSSKGMSTDEAVKDIRGPKGTTVTIIIMRGVNKITIPVVRDTIQIPTTNETYDKATGVYTIALYEFTANSSALFDAAFNNFKKSGSTKLIIDLRGNPGGYLDSAVHIASHFLPVGSPVVTEDYKGKAKNIVHTSTGMDDTPANTKIVILLNQGSASASEILAGALQDSKRATLIGTRSFGKGSVQEVINIGDSELKVTIARWLTPSGRSISDGGLTPDIKVDRTQGDVTAEKDPQAARAVQFLTTGN
jgi:carboxyl-terminal processing protease